MRITGEYQTDRQMLMDYLRAEASFDVVAKPLKIGGRSALLLMIDGFVKDDIMEKVMQFFLSAQEEDLVKWPTPDLFAEAMIPYVEVDTQTDVPTIAAQVLSGTVACLLDGYDAVFMIDARTYPVRGVGEPDDDRVLRGARDGFVETLVFNTAMVRRRIRDPQLTMEIFQVGKTSKTDVVLCYMADKADVAYLQRLREQLKTMDIPALTMGQESLAEYLLPKQWFNPFPRIRYTERPDCAAASVLEGRILILVDNTPSVMILPTAIFDFVQDTNDYYFPPLVGTYLRLIRMAIFFLTLFLTPVWYLCIRNPGWLPEWLQFIQVAEPNTVPILLQLFVVELVIDGVKLASLNTPSVLNNAFGIVGALILGEFAVGAKLFVPEVLLYMAVVAVATFTQPSFELGYAFKLFRMLFLLLIAIGDLWGFLAGILIMLLVLVTTKTIGGKNYLYPLIPFRWSALHRLLIRRRIHHDNG